MTMMMQPLFSPSFRDAASDFRQTIDREPLISILDEQPGDAAAREKLLDAAFGPSRSEKTCQRLREGRLPARGLALVAKDEDVVVGTLRFWHVLAGDAGPALLLGPLAIAASHRSKGLGGRMMGEGLYRALTLGHRAVLLVGDAPYYGRFGFGRACTRELSMPAPVDLARFLGFELAEGALARARGEVVATGALELRRGRRSAAREFKPAA